MFSDVSLDPKVLEKAKRLLRLAHFVPRLVLKYVLLLENYCIAEVWLD